jgi:hypothetical protein
MCITWIRAPMNSLKKKRNKQLLIVSWLCPLTKLTKVGHALHKALLLLPLIFSVGGGCSQMWCRSTMTQNDQGQKVHTFFVVFKTMTQFNYSCTIMFFLHWNNKYYYFFIMSHVIFKCQYLTYQKLFYFIFKISNVASYGTIPREI